MTDHTPLPVAGYTPQSDAAVNLANELKYAEERYLRILDRMAADTYGDGTSIAPLLDKAMIQLARRHMQTANMFAIRAIFQPTRIKLPEDTP